MYHPFPMIAELCHVPRLLTQQCFLHCLPLVTYCLFHDSTHQALIRLLHGGKVGIVSSAVKQLSRDKACCVAAIDCNTSFYYPDSLSVSLALCLFVSLSLPSSLSPSLLFSSLLLDLPPFIFMASMLKKLHASGNRVLVFSQMTALLDILQVCG